MACVKSGRYSIVIDKQHGRRCDILPEIISVIRSYVSVMSAAIRNSTVTPISGETFAPIRESGSDVTAGVANIIFPILRYTLPCIIEDDNDDMHERNALELIYVPYIYDPTQPVYDNRKISPKRFHIVAAVCFSSGLHVNVKIVVYARETGAIV